MASCTASKWKVCAQVNAFCLLHAFSMQNGSYESFCCKLQGDDDDDSAKWSAKVKLKSENWKWWKCAKWNVCHAAATTAVSVAASDCCGINCRLPQLPLTVSTYKALKLANGKTMLQSVSACHMPPTTCRFLLSSSPCMSIKVKARFLHFIANEEQAHKATGNAQPGEMGNGKCLWVTYTI